jgi:hypothetical protein
MNARRRPSPYEEPIAGRWLKAAKCDTCGQPVPWDPWSLGDRRRFRHDHCAPPTLPVAYRMTRRWLTVVDGRPRPATVRGVGPAPAIRTAGRAPTLTVINHGSGTTRGTGA